MKAIRCNADYESELFFRKKSSLLNESIEFLTFFLEERPLMTRKIYASEYLAYVQSVSGKLPATVRNGEAENWWGPLTDLNSERELNSKVTSTKLMQKNGWCDDTFILEDKKNLAEYALISEMIVKNPFEMSGRRFFTLNKENLYDCLANLPEGPLILEPLFNRVYDFSHYIFKNGEMIAYQNFIDARFQYKGTLFKDYQHPMLQNLNFYKLISEDVWENFNQALKIIISSYQSSTSSGFSVDSFIYQQNTDFKIRYLSEINYRKTMGLICYLLAKKYSQELLWSCLVIGQSQRKNGGFSFMLDRLQPLLEQRSSRVLILSPGDARFELFFISAADHESGKNVLERMNELLPDAKLPVEI